MCVVCRKSFLSLSLYHGSIRKTACVSANSVFLPLSLPLYSQKEKRANCVEQRRKTATQWLGNLHLLLCVCVCVWSSGTVDDAAANDKSTVASFSRQHPCFLASLLPSFLLSFLSLLLISSSIPSLYPRPATAAAAAAAAVTTRATDSHSRNRVTASANNDETAGTERRAACVSC